MPTPRNEILIGDALETLRALPDGIVQTCVTSPPYFGLRNYGHDGQIGQENTPEEYVQRLVEVFREVRRVLREDGTLWLNLGDSYSVGPSGRRDHGTDNPWSHLGHNGDGIPGGTNIPASANRKCPPGLKPKDLLLIPARVALALQADGWWVRAENIWHKPNVMPESVTDRTTRCHEHVYLLSRSERYFYDIDAIREPHDLSYVQRRHSFQSGEGKEYRVDRNPDMSLRYDGVPVGNPAGRNKRSVWTINPKPYKGAHFAVFPPELPEICIKAGTSEKGACSVCGAPYKRIVERPTRPTVVREVGVNERDGGITAEHGMERTGMSHFKYNEWLKANPPKTTGWTPSCACGEDGIRPCLVLDPFAGSGTTLATAKSLRRDYLGIELNPAYKPLIEDRVQPAVERESERNLFDMMMELEQQEDP